MQQTVPQIIDPERDASLKRVTLIDAATLVVADAVALPGNTRVVHVDPRGVAYVGIFDETSDTRKPALVFYNQLGSGSEKAVAEAGGLARLEKPHDELHVADGEDHGTDETGRGIDQGGGDPPSPGGVAPDRGW